MAGIYDGAVSHNFSRNASIFFYKIANVETVLLFWHQGVQLRHHMSVVALVPSKADPAGKKNLSYFTAR